MADGDRMYANLPQDVRLLKLVSEYASAYHTAHDTVLGEERARARSDATRAHAQIVEIADEVVLLKQKADAYDDLMCQRTTILRARHRAVAMADIVIVFRDGTRREFNHEGRSGGSYTKTVACKDGFVTVEDEWGVRTSFPSDTVAEVTERPNQRFGY